MGSKYGRRRIIRKAKVDRISNLPDDVLSHILSLLPTKCAVGTSILSNRWKNLWTAITCLDFEIPIGGSMNSNVVDFANFVDHVFRSCSSSHIEKLVLHCPEYWTDESRVTGWIDEGIRRSVSELDLNVNKLPLSVFSCTTLTVLTIEDCYSYDASVVPFDLPCLKVLHIKGGHRRFMEKLISSCPGLEDLTVGASYAWTLDDTFMVSAHTLKNLHLQINQHCFGGEIFVEAPNLECLHLSEGFILYNIKGIFSSLVKAYVNIGNISKRHHFQKVPCRFKLPNFSNLTCLEVITCDNRLWAILPKLIRSSPKLEALSLKQYGGDNMENDYYAWDEPKSVAKCLTFHLVEIKIEGFKGKKHELQLLKYLLGSAKVLLTLTINCEGLKRGEEIEFCGQLLKFSRASRYCQVQFLGDLISNV